MSDDSEDEDDFVDTRPVSSSERPIKTSLSSNSLEEEFAKVLKSIFKYSICLKTVCLPAAACASCYAVMGCTLVLSNGMLLAPMLHNVPCVVLL